MAVLTGNPVSTSTMTWNYRKHLMTCELSDLAGHMHRAYDDAYDIGVTLLNPITGRQLVVVQNHEERDAEGELLWIDFIPTRRDLRDRLTLRAYND